MVYSSTVARSYIVGFSPLLARFKYCALIQLLSSRANNTRPKVQRPKVPDFARISPLAKLDLIF